MVIFHPAPPLPNQTSEGGTLAIYPSTILSPLAQPNIVGPLATLPLPSDVLAIQYLYSSSSSSSSAKDNAKGSTATATTYGPRTPSSYSPSQGPAFLILTSSGIILFHPQLVPPPQGQLQSQGQNPSIEPQYAYPGLKCPLHSRWYAAMGGTVPPEIGRADRGWAGLVEGDEGVWFSFSDKGELGVIRASVIVKDGKACELTNPYRTFSLVLLEYLFTSEEYYQLIIIHSTLDYSHAANTPSLHPTYPRDHLHLHPGSPRRFHRCPI